MPRLARLDATVPNIMYLCGDSKRGELGSDHGERLVIKDQG